MPNTNEIGNTWIFDFNARYEVGQALASTQLMACADLTSPLERSICLQQDAAVLLLPLIGMTSKNTTSAGGICTST